MWDWLADNREWVFSGIGVAVLMVAIPLIWRLLRPKPRPQTTAGTAPPTGVKLDRVRARGADIRDVTSTGDAVAIENSTFQEEVRVQGAQAGQPTAAPAGRGGDVSIDKTTVGGNLTIGDTNVYPPAVPGEVDPRELRRAYLVRLCSHTGALPLLGVDRKAASDVQAARLSLDAVYTALLTGGRGGERADETRRWAVEPVAGRGEEKRLSAVAQLNRQPRLVLLGDPGSGKSTFVNFVARCLAGEALGDPVANLALLTAPLPPEDEDERRPDRDEKPQPQPWDHGALLPVRVVLRDFAARGLPPLGQRCTAEHLWRFIEGELAAANLADFAPHLRRELLEQGGILLLDGLDEAPEAGQRRSQIKAAVDDFAATFGRCRILVTSRTYAYQSQDWRLPRFHETVLAPFTRGQIRAFVDRWYEHIAQVRHENVQDAQGRAALLKQAIFRSERLLELAARPLLLTLTASLHAWRGGSLPERREDLYADAVDLLLDWWESQRVVRDAEGAVLLIQPSLAEWLKVDKQQVRAFLNRLAFDAHAGQPALVGTADVAEARLVAGLLELSRNPDINPARLVEFLSQRAGLLDARGPGVYAFPHRTFQEYLAACHLTDDDFPDKLAELARADANRWREVALLAGAKASRGTASAVWTLADALCYLAPGAGGYADADRWGSLLAGQALAEAGASAANPRNQDKLVRVRGGLLDVLGGAALPAVERALAGRSLAQLGDPRPEVMTVAGMHFCHVPAGKFVMGEGKEKDEREHENTVNYAYWVARFPVTNAQYAEFVQAGGYANADHWPEARKADYWSKQGFKGPHDRTWRTKPNSYGSPFDLPNHPAVGVTWYEAVAFCRWLTTHGRDQGWLPAGLSVGLPNELEWEKAARGGREVPAAPQPYALARLPAQAPVQRVKNPDSRRTYPWAGDFDADRANVSEAEIGSTSAVGCFAHGASPYGAEEMAGNAWEWTRSLWGTNFSDPTYGYPYRANDDRERLAAGPDVLRVVRGGAFFNYRDGGRCAARGRVNPYNDYRNGGFRVVLSPYPGF